MTIIDSKIVLGASVALALALALASCGAFAQAPTQMVPSDLVLVQFSKYDMDRDGRVDSAEFLASHRSSWSKYSNGMVMTIQACVQAELEKVLADGGQIDQTVQAMLLPGCERLDKNRDGTLSWEEYAGPQWTFFKLLDVNRDGFLTLAEYANQGVLGMRQALLAPKPTPSEALQAQMKLDLAQSKTGRKVTRSAAEVAAGLSAPFVVPAPSTAAQRAPAPSVPVTQDDSISNRISNWLR